MFDIQNFIMNFLFCSEHLEGNALNKNITRIFSHHWETYLNFSHFLIKYYLSTHSWLSGSLIPILAQTQTVMTQTCFNYQINAQFLYSITIYMLHYKPRHFSNNTMLIFRRSNCIITSSDIVTICKQLYSTPLSTGLLYGCLQRVTIPVAEIIYFDLLKMSIVLLETCRGL